MYKYGVLNYKCCGVGLCVAPSEKENEGTARTTN